MAIRKSCRGFSLLEVLVAFVMLALTLSVMMRIFSGGLRNVGLAGDYGRAVLLAQSRLAELRVQPGEGESAGEFDRRFRWRSSVRPWMEVAPGPAGDPLLPARLMEIEVKVSWGEEGRDAREIGLSSMQLVPRT